MTTTDENRMYRWVNDSLTKLMLQGRIASFDKIWLWPKGDLRITVSLLDGSKLRMTLREAAAFVKGAESQINLRCWGPQPEPATART